MQKRINGFQLLRGILICCVVLFHSLTIFVKDYAGHTQQVSRFGMILRNIIGTFQMPVFMALSGFLFYWSVKPVIAAGNYDLKGFIRKKIKRLIIPFFIIMFFWRKPLMLLASRKKHPIMSVNQLLIEYIKTTTTGGLWFLYVLFILFVIHYVFLRSLWKKETRLVVFFICSLCASTISFLLSGPIHHILFYNLYFFSGICLNHFLSNNSEHTVMKFRYLTRALFIISIVLSFVYSFDLVQSPLLKAGMYSIIACLDIMFIIPFFYKMNWQNKILDWLGRDSMGIYLFHEPLIICIGSFLPESIDGGGLSTILFIIGLGGSICMVQLIRKLRLEFIIGE